MQPARISNEDAYTGDRIDITIEKIVPKGFGLGFADGRAVFVLLTAPGDRVRARISKIKGNTIFAELEEVLAPGPDRSLPPCEYFGRCGGCDFQQLSYRAQLSAKVGIVRDCLKRIGKIDYEGEIPIVESSSALGYRLRVQWHLDAVNRSIGYYARETHDVVDVRHCPIATPEINVALDRLRRDIDWQSLPRGRVEFEAAHGSDGEISTYSADLLLPSDDVAFTARGECYAFSARTFFQGNQFQISNLIDLAVGGSSGRIAIDLFSGVGLFSLPLGRSFERVVAVESNETSVDFAEHNARVARLGNIEFVRKSVEAFLRSADIEGPDFVVFDPPRSGTSKEIVLRMAALNPKKISYISCEPSILARDLRWLVDSGYGIHSITALDLFPQTHHVETIVLLTPARE